VTITCGVPTIWARLIELVDSGSYDLSSLRRILVGGAAISESLIDRYEEHGIGVRRGRGMTAMSPSGTMSRPGTPTLQGVVVPGVKLRICDEAGSELPWRPRGRRDRGTRPLGRSRLPRAGRRRQRVTLPRRLAEDRRCRLARAGRRSPRRRPDPAGQSPGDEPEEFLRVSVAGWWVPDAFEWVDELPKTSVGKIDKRELRRRVGERSDARLVSRRLRDEEGC
jgi:acyl-CoA synthetase (AMP-forming)/AMP-acid ligase II